MKRIPLPLGWTVWVAHREYNQPSGFQFQTDAEYQQAAGLKWGPMSPHNLDGTSQAGFIKGAKVYDLKPLGDE